MTTISATLRQQVIERAKACCEYCQTQQKIVIEMQIDHIVPEALGGETALDNLCLACCGCNRFKGAMQTVFDIETQTEIPLFNPRTYQWTEHFQWDETQTRLIGLTPMGRITIELLRINRAELIAARKLWVKAGWHPPIFSDRIDD